MAVLRTLERDRIVEIAGIDRVDRHDRLIGEIVAAAANRFVELVGLLACFVERILGKLARQVELVDDRHRVDARLAASAEHFDDHAFAVADVRGEADHFDDDLVVRPHAFRAGIADVNWVR